MALFPALRALLISIGDSRLGDAIGVACLFGGWWTFLLLGHALIGGAQ